MKWPFNYWLSCQNDLKQILGNLTEIAWKIFLK